MLTGRQDPAPDGGQRQARRLRDFIVAEAAVKEAEGLGVQGVDTGERRLELVEVQVVRLVLPTVEWWQQLPILTDPCALVRGSPVGLRYPLKKVLRMMLDIQALKLVPASKHSQLLTRRRCVSLDELLRERAILSELEGQAVEEAGDVLVLVVELRGVHEVGVG